jgi:predicted anti-sigma-YlaC factor YlaD
MSDHLGDIAALYALGALEDGERAQADEHLSGCDACRRLLAQAEADVTAMEAARPQFDVPSSMSEKFARSFDPPRQRSLPMAWLAFAAAIVIAVVPMGYLYQQDVAMHVAMSADAQALVRVASTPHHTASFDGMNAHVMYATDGSWYCIVIRNVRAGVQVVWPHDGTQTMLGTATPHGDVALLYLPQSHRMDRLTIMQDGRVLGQAQLAF